MPAAIAKTTIRASALWTMLFNPTTSRAEPTSITATIQNISVAKSMKNTPPGIYYDMNHPEFLKGAGASAFWNSTLQNSGGFVMAIRPHISRSFCDVYTLYLLYHVWYL